MLRGRLLPGLAAEPVSPAAQGRGAGGAAAHAWAGGACRGPRGAGATPASRHAKPLLGLRSGQHTKHALSNANAFRLAQNGLLSRCVSVSDVCTPPPVPACALQQCWGARRGAVTPCSRTVSSSVPHTQTPRTAPALHAPPATGGICAPFGPSPAPDHDTWSHVETLENWLFDPTVTRTRRAL